MTTAIKGMAQEAPTDNEHLIAWVNEAVDLFQPDSVVFVDGSQEEWDRLAAELVDKGTLIKLNEEKRPNSYLARSNPCLLYTSPSPRDRQKSRMPSSA